MEALLPLIITFGLMWALLIRPQQRRVREHQQLVTTLSVGDEVITTGGIVGTIVAAVDDIVTLEVAPGTSIRLLRSAVQTRIASEPDDGLEEAYGAELAADLDDEFGADFELDEPVEVVAEAEETIYIPPTPPATPQPPDAQTPHPQTEEKA